MPRKIKYKPCDKKLFGYAVEGFLFPDEHAFLESIPKKDFGVEFSFENLIYDVWGSKVYGLNSIGDFHFFGMDAAGDWQYPVFFIVYWDGKKFRAWVPSKGNTYNTKTKAAFTLDDGDTVDHKNFRKQFPDHSVDDFKMRNLDLLDEKAILKDIEDHLDH